MSLKVWKDIFSKKVKLNKLQRNHHLTSKCLNKNKMSIQRLSKMLKSLLIWMLLKISWKQEKFMEKKKNKVHTAQDKIGDKLSLHLTQESIK